MGMDAPIKPGETWRMTVIGKPAPQGSKQSRPVMRWDHELKKKVPVLKNGVPVVNTTEANRDRLKPWRQDVSESAIAHGWPGLGMAALDEAVIVVITFFFTRPRSHYGTGRNDGVLKDSSPLYPETTGDDLDKLERAALDALTGIVYRDDKRVVTLPTRRRFGTPERMEISVRRPRARTVGELRRLRDSNPELAGALADGLQLDLFHEAAAHAPDQATGGSPAQKRRAPSEPITL
jgi:Holliday junction resolvase RusA-like endonuclease